MTTAYVDASAALKLVFDEPETSALRDHLSSIRADLVSSILLETEMRRAAHRSPELAQGDVTELLASIALIDATPSTFRAAGRLPGEHLRSLDALHLATATAVGADEILTYDRRLAASAEFLGLIVVAPR